MEQLITPTACPVCAAGFLRNGLGNALYECGMLYHYRTETWQLGCKRAIAVAMSLRERQSELVSAAERAVEVLNNARETMTYRQAEALDFHTTINRLLAAISVSEEKP